jgi:hypothetical protein
VLSMSTGDVPGRRRAWSRGTKLTEKGSSVVRQLGGREAMMFQRQGAMMGVGGGSGCSCSSEEKGRGEAPLDLKETARGVSSHRGPGKAAPVAPNLLSPVVLRSPASDWRLRRVSGVLTRPGKRRKGEGKERVRDAVAPILKGPVAGREQRGGGSS